MLCFRQISWVEHDVFLREFNTNRVSDGVMWPINLCDFINDGFQFNLQNYVKWIWFWLIL